MHSCIIPFDLTVRGRLFKVFHLPVVVKHLAHEKRITSLFVFEGAQFGIDNPHSAPKVVIFFDFEAEDAQGFLAFTSSYLGYGHSLRARIELDLHKATDAMVHSIFCLAISGEDSITQVCETADDATLCQNSTAHIPQEQGQLGLLCQAADHNHFI